MFAEHFSSYFVCWKKARTSSILRVIQLPPIFTSHHIYTIIKNICVVFLAHDKSFMGTSMQQPSIYTYKSAFWINLATGPFHSQNNFCRIHNKILIHTQRWTVMTKMTITKTKKIIYVMEHACKTLTFTWTLWNPRVLCNTIWETVLDTLDMANAASWQMEFLLTTSHISAHIMILVLSFWLARSNILLWMFTFSLLSWTSS